MVLLDTSAVIWLAEQLPMTAQSQIAIQQAATDDNLLISPVSAWEVGILATRRVNQFRFLPTPRAWFQDLFAMIPGMQLTPLTPEAAIAAAFLPGQFHRDPADRLLVATAREMGASLVTRDRRILQYAGQGHVQAIAC